MTMLLQEGGTPVPDEWKGGYGLALEKLATMLGCEDNLWQQQTDGPVEQVGQPAEPQVEPIDLPVKPTRKGWVNVTDCQDYDAIYHDGELVATVWTCARGSWFAKATHVDGRQWRCAGAGSEMVCEEWVAA